MGKLRLGSGLTPLGDDGCSRVLHPRGSAASRRSRRPRRAPHKGERVPNSPGSTPRAAGLLTMPGLKANPAGWTVIWVCVSNGLATGGVGAAAGCGRMGGWPGAAGKLPGGWRGGRGWTAACSGWAGGTGAWMAVFSTAAAAKRREGESVSWGGRQGRWRDPELGVPPPFLLTVPSQRQPKRPAIHLRTLLLPQRKVGTRQS